MSRFLTILALLIISLQTMSVSANVAVMSDNHEQAMYETMVNGKTMPDCHHTHEMPCPHCKQNSHCGGMHGSCVTPLVGILDKPQTMTILPRLAYIISFYKTAVPVQSHSTPYRPPIRL